MISKQVVFDFFTVKESARREVERLMRFGREHEGSKRYTGALHPVEYSAWLRFYSPLSEKGAA